MNTCESCGKEYMNALSAFCAPCNDDRAYNLAKWYAQVWAK